MRGLPLLLLVGMISAAAEGNLYLLPSAEEHTMFEGKNFYISCFSNATNAQRVMWTGPEEQQITKYEDSENHDKIERIHVEQGTAGHKGADLFFENIIRKDSGRYTCSAKVDGREESRSFQLFVDKRITFLDTPTTQYLEEGLQSELVCDVDGDPEPTVSWSAQGKKVNYGKKYRKASEGSNNLVVNNVTLEDGGKYECHAVQLSNRNSDVVDLTIDVKVHHKPQWNEKRSQTYSYLSGEVKLVCEVEAEPEANFTWTKEDEIIVPSDTVHITSDNNTSVLHLTVTDRDMFGDYLCKAQNKLGTFLRVIILEEGNKPAMPTAKVTKNEVDKLHLFLTAKNHPDMPVLAYRVEYKAAGDDWMSAPAVEFKKGDEYIINELKSDTLYVLRAAAKNEAGLSDYSTEVMGRTMKKNSLSGCSSSFSLSSYIALFLSLLLSASLL